MSFLPALYEAMAEYIRRQGGEVVQVTGFEEDMEYDGYCETCYYEYTVVNIEFENPRGETEIWQYRGYFADLLRELT